MQAAAFVVAEYWPAVQFVHVVVSAVKVHVPPAFFLEPAGHTVQAVHAVALAADHALPATQGVHALFEVAEQDDDR